MSGSCDKGQFLFSKGMSAIFIMDHPMNRD